jgi:predicted GNAT family acetyltransferase
MLKKACQISGMHFLQLCGMANPVTSLSNNETDGYFECWAEGERSFIDYKRKGNIIYLMHTEVPESLNGKGVGTKLVENVLQCIEKDGSNIVVLCPFVTYFIKKHPEWKKLFSGGMHDVDRV